MITVADMLTALAGAGSLVLAGYAAVRRLWAGTVAGLLLLAVTAAGLYARARGWHPWATVALTGAAYLLTVGGYAWYVRRLAQRADRLAKHHSLTKRGL